LPAPLETALRGELERRVLLPARTAGRDLPLLGLSSVPRGSAVVRADRRNWLLVSHEDDPTAERLGGIPVPREQHDALVALADAGVECDLVWLAHELPDSWRPGQPVLVPSPLRGLDSRVSGFVDGALALTTRTSRTLVRTVPAARRALARRPAPVPVRAPARRSQWENLDPIVLGGVRLEDHDAVAWAVLARWDW
jgi:hypothetical protein